MSFDLAALAAAIDRHGPVVRVVVARTAGSTPREAGTAMLVWSDGQSGSIGGGALEWEAARKARDLLAGEADRQMMVMPLGPALGQCCGGSVTLLAERFTALTLPARLPFARPLNPDSPVVSREPPHTALHPRAGIAVTDGWLIEAGATPARPTWVDFAASRFPDTIPQTVTRLVAAEPARVVPFAPANADHLILTHSHELDLAICHAVLGHRFASAGLIGSATKWARFQSRLAALGHGAEQIARIACPIGEPELGKHPQAVAVGVAAAMLRPAQCASRDMQKTGDRTG
jgi:xanthine dehydrogenase accessory factor